MRLTWEKKDGVRHWLGRSGNLVLAMVIENSDRQFSYALTGVSLEGIEGAAGKVAALDDGIAAADAAWKRWLVLAGIGGAA